MKRVISLLLCLVLACGMLVSCGETEIGKHAASLKEQFYIPPEEKISLKLYVVYEEADNGALVEVERRINALAESEYNTKLDVVYMTTGEYAEKVKAAAEAGEKAIVLIASAEAMNALYTGSDEIVVTELFDVKQATAAAPVVKVVSKYNESGVTVTKYDKNGDVVAQSTEADDAKIPVSTQVSVGYLEDLSQYVLKTDAKYGLLNAKIASALMDQAQLEYSVAGETSSGLFAIPNNHLIGGVNGYKYVKIDRQVCEIWLNYTKDYLAGIKEEAYDVIVKDENDEDVTIHYISIDDLKDEVRALGRNPDEYVQIIYGNQSTKAKDEADEKYILNVLDQPLVDEADVFSGAFAVLKGTDVERAMRIIYAINMDPALHNLLQYGIKDTNYTLSDDGVVTRKTDEGKNYKMNPLYTGNLFSVHYSAEWDWMPEVAAYAEAQNLAADAYYNKMKADAAQPAE